MLKILTRCISQLYYHGFQAGITVLLLIIWLRYHAINSSMVSILIACLSILLAILEFQFPANPSWIYKKKEFIKDMFYQFGIYYLYGPTMVAIAYPFFIDNLGGALKYYHLAIWPIQWPLMIKILLALLTIEFFNYWFHRAEHYFQWLWPLHSVHHSPNKMGWQKTTINHPLEYFVLIIIGVLPAAILGAESLELEGALLIYLTTALFAHCNLKLNHRTLSFIFTTNTYHLRHHSPILHESLSNYGCALVVWDRVFGTFKGYKNCQRVGIEPQINYSLVQELLLPFHSLPLGAGLYFDKK